MSEWSINFHWLFAHSFLEVESTVETLDDSSESSDRAIRLDMMKSVSGDESLAVLASSMIS